MGRDFTPVHLHFYADDRHFFVHLAEAVDQFSSLSLKAENSRISLQGSLLREPSLRMLSLLEIFTIKPHVLLKKKTTKKQKQGFIRNKFYHSPFIMTANCSPGLIGLF